MKLKNIHSKAELRFWVDNDNNEVDPGTYPGIEREVIVPPGATFNVKLMPEKQRTLLAGGFIAVVIPPVVAATDEDEDDTEAEPA